MTKQFDEILESRKKGSLKIYLGYAAGVGKTYSMLQEAHRLKERGFDVVIGYLEPHNRPETASLVSNLEVIPRRFYSLSNKSYEEMNLAAVINRMPQIALVDELAHTNAPGSKNGKRYEDIFELLDKGINVISTMNVQHLESVSVKVRVGTGIEIRERVPDLILQRADQVVTVDVSIEDLRERLRIGKVYKQEMAEKALTNFFSESNLSMLREIALKEAARDQSRRIDEQALLSQQAITCAHETVMVCLSSDPTNAEILICKGTKMALQLASYCYVVYVQKRSEGPTAIDSALQRKVQKNLTLAKQLGAEVVTLYGENVSDLLVNFAAEKNVRHAVFGKSRKTPFKDRLMGSVLLDFTYDAVGVDVHTFSTLNGESS
ncbi:MAG: kinase [Bdellovibrionia bacterium]